MQKDFKRKKKKKTLIKGISDTVEISGEALSGRFT